MRFANLGCDDDSCTDAGTDLNYLIAIGVLAVIGLPTGIYACITSRRRKLVRKAIAAAPIPLEHPAPFGAVPAQPFTPGFAPHESAAYKPVTQLDFIPQLPSQSTSRPAAFCVHCGAHKYGAYCGECAKA